MSWQAHQVLPIVLRSHMPLHQFRIERPKPQTDERAGVRQNLGLKRAVEVSEGLLRQGHAQAILASFGKECHEALVGEEGKLIHVEVERLTFGFGNVGTVKRRRLDQRQKHGAQQDAAVEPYLPTAQVDEQYLPFRQYALQMKF